MAGNRGGAGRGGRLRRSGVLVLGTLLLGAMLLLLAGSGAISSPSPPTGPAAPGRPAVACPYRLGSGTRAVLVVYRFGPGTPITCAAFDRRLSTAAPDAARTPVAMTHRIAAMPVACSRADPNNPGVTIDVLDDGSGLPQEVCRGF